MSVSLDPALCSETTNPNYTAGTFDLYVTREGGEEILIGNIQSGSFAQEISELLEHRRGKDNSLDQIIALGRDYTINFTADEITAQNLALMLNEQEVLVAEGCKIPLTGGRCIPEFGARLIHDYPCADHTLTIRFWRSQIISPFELAFNATDWASFDGAIRSLSCESIHPSEPYGHVIISGPCESS